jgi:hypothetical protein
MMKFEKLIVARKCISAKEFPVPVKELSEDGLARRHRDTEIR